MAEIMALQAIEPTRCALLFLDFTSEIVPNFATQGDTAVESAAMLAEVGRVTGALNVFVIPGQIGSDGNARPKLGAPVAALVPKEGDRLLYKDRIGAFSTTGLDVLLRQSGRDILIVAGVATSGTVLSTTRMGFDLGYRMVVAEDACSDPEDAVHALLTTPQHPQSWIGLWRIAEVAPSAAIAAALTSGSTA